MHITLAKLTRALREPEYRRLVLNTNWARWKEAWQHRRGFAPPPNFLVVFLTDRCNLRCCFCGQWGPKGVQHQKPPQVMSFATFETLLAQVYDFRPHLVFMGGEPLLHPQWEQFARAAKVAGLGITLITNGSLLADQARRVVEVGLDSVQVSLDGPAAVHDQLRGAGIYAKVVKGLRLVAEERTRQGKSLPHLAVAATISPETYRTLPALAEELRSLPVEHLQIQHLSFLTAEELEAHNRIFQAKFKAESLNLDGLVQEIGAMDAAELLEILRRLQSGQYPFTIGFGPNYSREEVATYYGHPLDFVRQTPPRCQFIWKGTTIYPDGQVTPCLNFAAGKVSEQNFLAIWNNPAYRRFRRILERDGYLPACRRCCN